MYRVITFDVYGTLVDWVYSIKNFLMTYISHDVVDEYFRCDIEEVKRYRPYKEILRTCLMRVAEKRNISVDDVLIRSFVKHFARSPPFPDTIYGLNLLKREGYKLGVISNTDKDLIEITLYGIKDLFDYIVTAEDTGFYKPDPRAFQRAFQLMNVDPREIVHVSAYPQYDLETAHSLGVKTVHLNRYGYKWSPEIRILSELPDLLKRL